jgi:hypothetical protein
MKVALYCQWGPRVRTLVHSSYMGLPGHSSWFPGAQFDDAWDNFWRCRCLARLYLDAKPSHVGVNVDRLAHYLHHPIVSGHQMRSQRILSGAALSHRVIVGSGAFLGVARPSGLDISCSFDHLGTCITESYMEKLAFTRACLSYVRVIMKIKRVSMV